jgi:hypothetical protein
MFAQIASQGKWSLTPWLARRELRFKANSPGARLLVEQLRDFPHADHDDGPDALEMAVRVLCEAVGDGRAGPGADAGDA